jgi:hypothetical protein
MSQNKLRAARFAGYRIYKMEERRCVGNEFSPSGEQDDVEGLVLGPNSLFLTN